MGTIISTLEERWQEVGLEGVRPALGGPERTISKYEEYVRNGLLNVFYYEIDTRQVWSPEFHYYKRQVERAKWDNTGKEWHKNMMAVVCWHFAFELGQSYEIGQKYPNGLSYDVADTQCLLPFEVGEYGETSKLNSLLQARAFSNASKGNEPTPNGVGRVAFAPRPHGKSTSKKWSAYLPVFVFTKRWMKKL